MIRMILTIEEKGEVVLVDLDHEVKDSSFRERVQASFYHKAIWEGMKFWNDATPSTLTKGEASARLVKRFREEP